VLGGSVCQLTTLPWPSMTEQSSSEPFLRLPVHLASHILQPASASRKSTEGLQALSACLDSGKHACAEIQPR
jgi:hypothetical protein